MTDFDKLSQEITRENASELLADVACPECGSVGQYTVFDEINNNGVGLRCDGCGKHHPFVRQRIMWLRGGPKRRSNDIVAVIKECGAYCYLCGETFEDLEKIGIGPTVHHTRAFADHGETYKKIPVCTECHELANFMQRVRARRRRCKDGS
jgi:hypothetical protein